MKKISMHIAQMKKLLQTILIFKKLLNKLIN